MDIEQIRTMKKKLAADILASAATLIAEFEADTSMNIKSVDLHFMETQSISESDSVYMLSDAAVEVNLNL